jgi:hypothetical protein
MVSHRNYTLGGYGITFLFEVYLAGSFYYSDIWAFASEDAL